MNNSEKIEATKSLTKLFGSFPQSPMSDPDLQLRAYLEAVEDFECVDVLAAVERLPPGRGQGGQQGILSLNGAALRRGSVPQTDARDHGKGRGEARLKISSSNERPRTD